MTVTSGQRLNLTNDADYDGVIETGRALAKMLDVPLHVLTSKRMA